MSQLILVRHGQSVWNAANLFTGWVDVDLTEVGRAEALAGGKRLAAEGVHVDLAFTSTLIRAIETGRIVLEALGQGDLEQKRAWQLNERYYGALTGKNKAETAERFGAEQVQIWRRSYATPPPGGESLRDTSDRALPYFKDVVLEACREHPTVFVAAHGNSLRAVMKYLDELDDDEIVRLEIPTGVPIMYELDDDLRPVSRRSLGPEGPEITATPKT